MRLNMSFNGESVIFDDNMYITTPYAFTSYAEAKAMKDFLSSYGISTHTEKIETYCYHIILNVDYAEHDFYLIQNSTLTQNI